MSSIREKTELFLNKIRDNKYLALAAIIGVILMLIPNSTSKKTEEKKSADFPDFSVSEQEKKLESILKSIDGAGDVKVMLTLESGTEQVFAYDSTVKENDEKNELVTVNNGSGVTKPVTVKYIYPKFLGAAVVCSGADSSKVRLSIIETVTAVTGLSADKISVIKMK